MLAALTLVTITSVDSSLETHIEGNYTCYTCTSNTGACIADINSSMYSVGDCFEPDNYATNGRCYWHTGDPPGIPRCTPTIRSASSTWEVVWGDCVVEGPCVEDGSGPNEDYSVNQACTVKALQPLNINVEYFETGWYHAFVTFDRSTRYYGDNGPANVTMNAGDTFLWRSDNLPGYKGWKFCGTTSTTDAPNELNVTNAPNELNVTYDVPFPLQPECANLTGDGLSVSDNNDGIIASSSTAIVFTIDDGFLSSEQTCSYFVDYPFLCNSEGDDWHNAALNLTANEACCVCGGGTNYTCYACETIVSGTDCILLEGPGAGTCYAADPQNNTCGEMTPRCNENENENEQDVNFTLTSTLECTDSAAGFYDPDGLFAESGFPTEVHNCYNWKTAAAAACINSPWVNSDGVTVNEACCVCGGGTNRSCWTCTSGTGPCIDMTSGVCTTNTLDDGSCGTGLEPRCTTLNTNENTSTTNEPNVTSTNAPNTYESPNEFDWSNVSTYCLPVRYKVHVSPRNWLDAEAACVALGGHLASIHSKAEQDTVYNLIAAAGLLSAWIGYNDRDAEVGCTDDDHQGIGGLIEAESMTWSDGTQSDYENWIVLEPNGLNYSVASGRPCDGSGYADCTEIVANTSNGVWYDEGQLLSPPVYGSWNDFDCAALKPYVCGFCTDAPNVTSTNAPNTGEQNVNVHVRSRSDAPVIVTALLLTAIVFLAAAAIALNYRQQVSFSPTF